MCEQWLNTWFANQLYLLYVELQMFPPYLYIMAYFVTRAQILLHNVSLLFPIVVQACRWLRIPSLWVRGAAPVTPTRPPVRMCPPMKWTLQCCRSSCSPKTRETAAPSLTSSSRSPSSRNWWATSKVVPATATVPLTIHRERERGIYLVSCTTECIQLKCVFRHLTQPLWSNDQVVGHFISENSTNTLYCILLLNMKNISDFSIRHTWLTFLGCLAFLSKEKVYGSSYHWYVHCLWIACLILCSLKLCHLE